jgi:hypothetical protein
MFFGRTQNKKRPSGPRSVLEFAFIPACALTYFVEERSSRDKSMDMSDGRTVPFTFNDKSLPQSLGRGRGSEGSYVWSALLLSIRTVLRSQYSRHKRTELLLVLFSPTNSHNLTASALFNLKQEQNNYRFH